MSTANAPVPLDDTRSSSRSANEIIVSPIESKLVKKVDSRNADVEEGNGQKKRKPGEKWKSQEVLEIPHKFVLSVYVLVWFVGVLMKSSF